MPSTNGFFIEFSIKVMGHEVIYHPRMFSGIPFTVFGYLPND